MKHKRVINRLLISTLIRCSLVLVLFMPLAAQAQLSGVGKGERVRITAPTVQSGKIKGTVEMLSSSTLTLTHRDTTLVIPYASIQKAEVVNGKKRNIGKGALIGAAGGAVFLGILSAATNKPCEGEGWCFFEMSNAEAFAFGALAGALGGAINGAIIGTFVKTDRWEEVPVQISASVFQSPNGSRAIGPKLVVRF